MTRVERYELFALASGLVGALAGAAFMCAVAAAIAGGF